MADRLGDIHGSDKSADGKHFQSVFMDALTGSVTYPLI
jgi:hypothetical protein